MTKKKQPEPFNNPFGGLKLPQKPVHVAAPAPARQKAKPQAVDAEAALFLEAVGEVERPRQGPGKAPPPPPRSAADVPIRADDAESLARLAELVSGEGELDVTDSDELIEGAVRGFDARVLRALRQGGFAPQARLDLHGLTRDEARAALEPFLRGSRVAGHRCVLVVTGRGLRSEDQVPVLKAGLQQWLSRGRLAKQVLAFCTARPSDGGAGAVYVLLRR